MLDGLRGFCAIAVMIYHYLSWNKIEFFQVGTFGVYIFFILSGFSMWHVYGHRELSKKNLHNFFVARFARIFPLYFLVNLLVYFGSTPLKTFLLNITFLFGVAAPGLTSGVTGGWSIGIEWVFYLIFPIFWIFAPTMTYLLLLLAAAIAINQIYVGSLFRQADLRIAWIDYSNFPVFLVYFVAGMLSAKLYQNTASLRINSKYNWTYSMATCACLAFVFFYPSDTVENYLWGYHFTALVVISMLAVLLCSYIQSLPAPVIKICTFLGDISFSAYLVHYFVYTYGMRIRDAYFPSLELSYVLPMLVISTLCIAYILFRLYEMPARNLINKRFAYPAVA